MGIFIPTGWRSIFEKLCEDIDALLGLDKRGFHFIQCKEKFGSARWYWGMRKVKRPVRVDIFCGVGGWRRYLSECTEPEPSTGDPG